MSPWFSTNQISKYNFKKWSKGPILFILTRDKHHQLFFSKMLKFLICDQMAHQILANISILMDEKQSKKRQYRKFEIFDVPFGRKSKNFIWGGQKCSEVDLPSLWAFGIRNWQKFLKISILRYSKSAPLYILPKIWRVWKFGYLGPKHLF